MRPPGARGPAAWLAAASVALAALPLAGCLALGPAYRRPELALPATYSQATLEGAVPDAWWEAFRDPALDALEQEALAANQDLAAAAARVEEARALAGIARADRFPQLTAQVSGNRSRLSQETAELPPGFDLTFDRFDATVDLTFELDFWGRLRRASQAARAELLASQGGWRNVRLGLEADVADAYFDRSTFDRQLAIARETLDSRRESVRLQRVRYDAGSISELDLAQAEAELAATEATVPVLERQVRQTEDRLTVLLGRIGGAAVQAAAVGLEAGPGGVELPAIPAGLPSELLVRRPDVAAAEQRLIAANARIGAARAAYFPAISLTGYAGSESAELSGLFRAGTSIWGAALDLLEPIFNAGRTRRQVEAQTALQRQALAAYVKAVQTAFADVEDGLVARSTGIAQREALARQVEALGRARRLAVLRYEAGDASYLEVLDAERNLFRAQLDLAGARRGELGAAITLFKALGGGWEAKAPGF